MNVKEWIKKCERFNSHLYPDTVGKVTIGYGRNIEDNGISIAEANFMFENDFQQCLNDLIPYKWYTGQPDNIKNALMNMCFNLGINKLLGFKRMIEAIENNDYTKAAFEALNSKWAKQVGDRAKDVALMIRQG